MDSLIPFFKISELAGKRWPNVTEEDIYNWHDKDLKVNVDSACGMVERTPGDMWNFKPHFDEINILSFWVFLPEFHSILSYALLQKEEDIIKSCFEIQGKDDPANSTRVSVETWKRLGAPFPYDLLNNKFFLIGFDAANGFAYNEDGKISCMLFFDEYGREHISGVLDKEQSHYIVGQLEIKKEELLIKASSVRAMEKIVPEITSFKLPPKANGKFECTLPNPPGSEILETWKAVAVYVGCSLSTAKRRFKDAVQHTETGKVISTTAAIDEFRLKTATNKKNKRGAR